MLFCLVPKSRAFLLSLLAFICFSFSSSTLAQSPWSSFPNAKLVTDEFHDADSFLVQFERNGKKERHLIRLYYVDAPETAASTDSDRKRVLEQARYFGIDSPSKVIDFGNQATTFVEKLLRDPFTLQTAFATAPGRSSIPRIYATIQLANGRNLAEVLVEEGLARAKGTARSMPDGTSAAEYSAYISDLEASAMLGRKGIWSESNPSKLAASRAKEREDGRLLRELFEEGKSSQPINLNTASPKELENLPGVGPVLAARLVESRPLHSTADLLKIKGISHSTLQKWDGLFTLRLEKKSP